MTKHIPALFIGSPISFIVTGGLVLAGLSGGLALAAGFTLGTLAAKAFLAWI